MNEDDVTADPATLPPWILKTMRRSFEEKAAVLACQRKTLERVARTLDTNQDMESDLLALGIDGLSWELVRDIVLNELIAISGKIARVEAMIDQIDGRMTRDDLVRVA